jgi:hypothetical protein
MEVDSGLFPPSLYGPFRQVLEGGNFGEREPAEELQVDQFSELRLDFRQLIQGIADCREFFGVDKVFAWLGLE